MHPVPDSFSEPDFDPDPTLKEYKSTKVWEINFPQNNTASNIGKARFFIEKIVNNCAKWIRIRN
jgi:hypothetical protein